jgi:DNA-binding transcriptional LysR family regulator
MDLDLLKTFLEVNRLRHFGKAADSLCITPSAVSARIKLLEEKMGTVLFVRLRNNLQLTGSGEHLVNHARLMVKNWERARYELGVQNDKRQHLTVLTVPSLWEMQLIPRIEKLLGGNDNLALRVELLPSEIINHRLLKGEANIGILFEPVIGPDIELVELDELELVMVTNQQGITIQQALSDGYMQVEWGGNYLTRHGVLYPELTTPTIWISMARAAQDLLMRHCGKSCYLPRFMVQDHLKQKQLFLVKEAEAIQLPVYMAYLASTEIKDLV